MIEIGRSLPNLTSPTLTIALADVVAFTGKALAFGATITAEATGSTLFPTRISGLRRRRRVHHCHFTEENGVGASNWLAILATIGPSSSDLLRAAIHSGSDTNAVHFLSRSASDSQARK